MKYLKQLLIILLVSLIGEGLKMLIPLPIPASIYGMVIMFTCLTTGVIKLEKVKQTGKFLIEIMPVMFIPAGVGLLTVWDVLKPVIVPVIVITIITLIAVMVSTGWISQLIIRSDRRNRRDK